MMGPSHIFKRAPLLLSALSFSTILHTSTLFPHHIHPNRILHLTKNIKSLTYAPLFLLPGSTSSSFATFSPSGHLFRQFSSVSAPFSPQVPFLLNSPSPQHPPDSLSLNMASDSTPTTPSNPDRVILPTNVKPLHYNLTLEPDLVNFTYHGIVEIDLITQEPTDFITLNALDLKILSNSITFIPRYFFSSVPDPITDMPVSFDSSLQTVTLNVPQTIEPSTNFTLRLEFSGTLNTIMAGFYRSSYKDKFGETKYMATTQMEPTDARRTFPCFDEPALKAKFSVTLIADKNLTCLSNMDVIEEKDIVSTQSATERKAVSFRTTPLMSTYLLAFIVGELNYIETKQFRVPIRLYATPDWEVEHGRFSLDLAADTLEFYEKIFASEYPLPKVDMVAIPDFSSGAMENWGLITYRVVDLLYDPKSVSSARKKRVAEVVQHELAHQWFGNLVTMDFWDGIWLNEGFATWVAYYAMNKFFPEWKIWDEFLVDDFQNALNLDSLPNSHPIEVPVKRADEINQIFDSISYSKGSCVLRMISRFIGEEKFLEGVQVYISRHAYGNTRTSDLWDALMSVTDKPIDKIMDIWTRNVGYPVVTVTENEKNSSLTVKQNRFLQSGPVSSKDNTVLYPVFLDIQTGSKLYDDLVLFDREQTFQLDSLEFYKINSNHTSLYRTFYPPERLLKLGKAAAAQSINISDRTGLLSDAGALAVSGHHNTTTVLKLLEHFRDEPDKCVWDSAIRFIRQVQGTWMFEDEDVKKALRKFCLSIVQKKTHEMGWEILDTDDSIIEQFKATMFSVTGSLGDEKIREACRKMFDEFMSGNRDAVHPAHRYAVFSITMMYGGEEEWNALVNEYRTAPTFSEREDVLRCIGRSSDPKLIKKTLDFALSKEVRTQDIVYPLASLSSHREGIEALWEWLTTNWTELEKILPPSLSIMSSVVRRCTIGFTKEEQAQQIVKFFQDRNTAGFDKALAQMLDYINASSEWVGRDGAFVELWLKENKYF